MRRVIRAALLRENAYGTSYPAPTEHTLDLSRLDGGLNLWELDYRMSANQSPDMLNMWWNEGCLASRTGQSYIYEPLSEDDPYGPFYAAYKRPWHDRYIMQKGEELYAVDTDGTHTLLLSGLTEGYGGTFFTFGNKLYYMNGHEYICINESRIASVVEGYVPVIMINRKPGDPDEAGGQLYEQENRISSKKIVKFTADGVKDNYYLPVTGAELVSVEVDGTATTAYTYTASTGLIEFTDAPPDTDENNVVVTYSKPNTDAMNSILGCRCVTVYGTGSDTVVVCGGPDAQPNAYFWSGNTSLGFDPTYFPMNNYNLAGNNDEFVTAFGKQQNTLVIFKERSIGKTTMDTTEIDGMVSANLPYKRVNDEIGCDLEGSVQLVENNLVFADSERGVFVLANTSEADENNIVHISRNIDGDNTIRGLLTHIKSAADDGYPPPCSFDDGQRYWLCVGKYVYLWDYKLGGYRSKEENLSWFLFDNIHPVSWFTDNITHMYGRADGAIVEMTDRYNDFGEAYTRRYKFATQHFGTYDVLKDVVRAIFSLRSATDFNAVITYETDWERRKDRTPIAGRGWHLSPRNLAYRNLGVVAFAATAIRTPRCFHIKHFTMTLTNNDVDSDMSIVSAQLIYRYHRRDR